MEKNTIESTALAVVEDEDQLPVQAKAEGGILAAKSIFDIAPGQFKKGLARRKENRDTLFDWLKDNLINGTDYGQIHVVKKDKCGKGRYCDNPHHFSKASLWKSGAEKIVGMLGLRVTWPDLEEAKRDLKKDGKIIILTCHVLNGNGQMIAEGMGARDIKADSGDINKAIKMAKKSSMIDAVLNVGGMSEVFTQDVEDMDPEKIGSQDPFNPNEEPSEKSFANTQRNPIETHCPIGKEWRGKTWNLVDEGFLVWIVSNIDDKPELVERAKKEIGNRGALCDNAKDRATDEKAGFVPGKRLAEYAHDITHAKHIDEIIAIKDELPAEFEPGLRSFIKTRENELGPQ